MNNNNSGLGARISILFRPDRWKYIKRKDSDKECVFCRAANDEPTFDTLTVYKSEHSMIVLNKYPYNTGHLLVIPRRHNGDFLAIGKAEFDDLNQTLKIAVKAVKDVYESHGINIGLNLEKAAGAGLPDHLHYHIVPRFRGDMNFFPLIAETKVVPEALEETYRKMRNYFERV